MVHPAQLASRREGKQKTPLADDQQSAINTERATDQAGGVGQVPAPSNAPVGKERDDAVRLRRVDRAGQSDGECCLESNIAVSPEFPRSGGPVQRAPAIA